MEDLYNNRWPNGIDASERLQANKITLTWASPINHSIRQSRVAGVILINHLGGLQIVSN